MENVELWANLVVAASGLLLLIALREQLRRVTFQGAPIVARRKRNE